MDENQRNTYLRTCRDRIAVHGHMIQHVFGEPTSFSYSAGLTPSLGCEILTIGLPQQVAHSLLNDLAKRLAIEAIADGVDIERIANMPLRLRTVPLRDPATGRSRREIVNTALALGYAPTSVRQLLWPDRGGRFPGEVGYDHPCTQQIDDVIEPEFGD